jgi:hypothetical protein
MTQTVRDCGVYAAGTYKETSATPPADLAESVTARRNLDGLSHQPMPKAKPGACLVWEERVKELPEITGSPELIQRIWEDIEAFGNMYVWQLLLSF